MNIFAFAKPAADEPGEDATEPADAPDGTGDCPDAIKAPRGLTPARAALARHLAWIHAIEADLEKLNAGKAKLEADIGKVEEAKAELERRAASDAATLAGKVKAGHDWSLSQFGGQDVAEISARIATSRHQAAIAERALAQTEVEIANTEGMLATLRGRKDSFVAMAVLEAAQGIYQDYAVILDELRETMAQLEGLSAHLDSAAIVASGEYRPQQSVVVHVPKYRHSGLVTATLGDIRAAQVVWAKFAAALEANPKANAEKLLKFPAHDPSAPDLRPYHERHAVERQQIDREFAQGERA